MATLQELMAEVLDDNSAKVGMGKEASAAKPSTAAEVDQVLENLGLPTADAVTKTAAAVGGAKNNGGNMSLAEIYEQIIGGDTAAVTEQEKTAAANTGATASEENTTTSAFGELVGEYFNEVTAPYFEKVSASLEVEAGHGTLPLAGATTGGSMTAALGKPKDPQLPMNHDASSGAHLQVTTGGTSPYKLKESVLKKTILKRMDAAPVGNIVD